MSFGGIDGTARYGQTCLADVLPVTVSAGDDRVERPAGVTPVIDRPGHPTVAAIAGPWPRLLGYNRLTARPPGEVVASCGNDPLLAVGAFGRGRSVAFASDLGPHWAPAEFTSWEGYPALWHGIASWAAGLDHRFIRRNCDPNKMALSEVCGRTPSASAATSSSPSPTSLRPAPWPSPWRCC